jgi:hypothetical protein
MPAGCKKGRWLHLPEKLHCVTAVKIHLVIRHAALSAVFITRALACVSTGPHSLALLFAANMLMIRVIGMALESARTDTLPHLTVAPMATLEGLVARVLASTCGQPTFHPYSPSGATSASSPGSKT